MPNVERMVKAAKVVWIKRMIVEAKNINATAKALLLSPSDLTMSLSSYSIKYMKIRSDFYRQIITHWYDVLSVEPQNRTGEVIFSLEFYNALHYCVDSTSKA